MKILFIDHHDSFTYNLVALIEPKVNKIKVQNIDHLDLENLIEYDALVLGPGPGGPRINALKIFEQSSLPIFGVCLGMQTLAQAYGAKVIRSNQPLHGEADHIYHKDHQIFKEIPSPFLAARYHSLMVLPESLNKELICIAWNKKNVIMGLSHSTRPHLGVQFHPESFLTEYGEQIIDNFLRFSYKFRNYSKISSIETLNQ